MIFIVKMTMQVLECMCKHDMHSMAYYNSSNAFVILNTLKEVNNKKSDSL